MDNNFIKKFYLYLLYIVVLFTTLFYFVGYNDLSYLNTFIKVKNQPTNTFNYESLYDVSQEFYIGSSYLNEISVLFETFNSNNELITITIENNQEILYQDYINLKSFNNGSYYKVKFENPLYIDTNYPVIMKFSIPNNSIDKKTSIWYSANKSDNNNLLKVNGQNINGEICFTYVSSTKIPFTQIVLILFSCLLVIVYLLFKRSSKSLLIGKEDIFLISIDVIRRYRFLLKQLVSRDFKIKYRRSILGVFWSFLNPLLTMLIQYVVFSSIFRTSISNYPVYLLSGIVIFNSLTESSTMALTAIVSNFSLIKKVKVPLYVFPISRVLTSVINLFVSLIPLLIVMILTGTSIDYRIILIPFVLIFLIIFLMGIGLVLSSFMVFFRDIQFLWSVFLMIWMYATPIFYPAEIIPAKFAFILKLNPLFYFIYFIRSVILENSIPSIKIILPIILIPIITFVVGLFVFRKNQERFIYYV